MTKKKNNYYSKYENTNNMKYEVNPSNQAN